MQKMKGLELTQTCPELVRLTKPRRVTAVQRVDIVEYFFSAVVLTE
jgi:hypothetical protein